MLLNVFLFFSLLFCIPLVTCFHFWLGPGQWLVMNTMQCENPEQYDLSITLSRKKMNRTHDSFHLIIRINTENVNDTFPYGVQIDVYKEVDGGFKYYQSLSDPKLCEYVKQHSRKNLERALTLAGVDPPDCPITGNILDINNFIMDYRELPLHGVYGTYDVFVYATLNNQNVGCTRMMLNFDEQRDDDDD